MPARAFASRFGTGFGGPVNVGTLALKIGTTGPDPAYQDGDIVCAFNRRRTRHVHAEVICHPRRGRRTSDGLLDPTHHSHDWCERTFQYRFQRVSLDTVARTNLFTMEVDVIGRQPNERGEQMDVALYVERRRKSPTCLLFGSPGAEVWYGGTQRSDPVTLDGVWDVIEQKTPLREVDFGQWPIGVEEAKRFLFLHVDDFDDAEESALVAPVTDNTDPNQPVMVRKRARRIPWRELRDMSTARVRDIEDQALPIDIRAERKHVRSQVVRVK